MPLKNILCIEDDPYLAEALKEMLAICGFNATLSFRSTEALRLIQSHPDMFDLVISDLNMPNINGIELVKAVRDIQPGLHFILCTGDSDIDVKKIKDKTGINEIIFKPFQITDLISTINRIVET